MVRIEEEHRGVLNRRFVVALPDESRVEAVLYRGNSLCVSSQVGCAVGCPFCASGADGLTRPLDLEELIGQVEVVRARGHSPTHVTVSGVGEPLHAAAAVETFIEWCRGDGLKPSLTTSGGPLHHLAHFVERVPHNGLTVSVHAGTAATRARLVPKGPPLTALFETLETSVAAIGNNRKKRTALAYLLVAGANDSDRELAAFAALAAPLGLTVHLYALNPVPTSDLGPASRSRYEEAYERLSASGLLVRMSSTARIEHNGGCGTLVALGKRRRRMAEA